MSRPQRSGRSRTSPARRVLLRRSACHHASQRCDPRRATRASNELGHDIAGVRWHREGGPRIDDAERATRRPRYPDPLLCSRFGARRFGGLLSVRHNAGVTSAFTGALLSSTRAMARCVRTPTLRPTAGLKAVRADGPIAGRIGRARRAVSVLADARNSCVARANCAATAESLPRRACLPGRAVGVGRASLESSSVMCQRVDCSKCGKPTYAGCGRHIEAVLAGVPRAERCRCREGEPARAPMAVLGSSWLGSLFRRDTRREP